jgi:hypothetical protein
VRIRSPRSMCQLMCALYYKGAGGNRTNEMVAVNTINIERKNVTNGALLAHSFDRDSNASSSRR